MPTIDEDTLRDLMHRSTGDLHASPAVTTGIVADHRRRHQRTRALGFGATGIAAGVAVTLVAVNAGGAHPAPAGPRITLTAAQQTLNHFSSVAARAPQPKGRYVVFSEKQGNLADGTGDYLRTSVIDSVTGDVWTYQKGAGVPTEPSVDRHGSLTEAQYNALPTSPAALRAALISQADKDRAAAIKAEEEAIKGRGLPAAQKKRINASKLVLRENSSDKVFDEASLMLWNPLVGPALRSGLFKVLAQTPGVVVNQHAQDSSGRAAVEISRHQTYGPVDLQVFENPAGTSVLETASTWPRASEDTGDLYLSITRTATVPANPYHS
jgi:hypothetical protein